MVREKRQGLMPSFSVDISNNSPFLNSQDSNYELRMIFDEADMLERLEDIFLVRSIMQESLLELPALIKELQELSLRGNCHEIEYYAHTLKGLAANVSTHNLYNSAASLEKSARNGALKNVRELLPEVMFNARLAHEEIRKACDSVETCPVHQPW